MNNRALLTAAVGGSLLILANILTTNRSISLSAASPPAAVTPSLAADDLIAFSPSAPSCSSPRWDLDSGGGVNLHCWNNVYVVSVDLRNPEVEVRPAEVYRPNPLSSAADGDTIARAHVTPRRG
ncbi:MAG: hypothetical protein CVU38_07610 [Chloroflexi bacterium HGW-Chloroflexi-1]|nr:MAG: hypothetical protein CVU38_07610 [Chloroflexi bacterium HGW-Chloroflexi-1]